MFEQGSILFRLYLVRLLYLLNLVMLGLRLAMMTHVGACVLRIFTLLKGYPVFRPNRLPRILGVLSAVGGLGWRSYLYEPLASLMAGYIVSFAVVTGFSTALSLLVFV